MNDLTDFDPAQLAGFKAAQALAYRCVEDVAARLRPGMTERQATRMMARYLRERGVRHYFHTPFAWFGDRTTLQGFRTDLQFFPTWRRLREGMPFILDVAPIVDGYAADVGYSSVLGSSAVWDVLDDDLERLRASILAQVQAGEPFGRIYEHVDDHILRAGYRNSHQRYPARVLAHRVFPVAPTGVDTLRVAGFGLGVVRRIRALLNEAKRGAEHAGPFWNDRSSRDLPPHPGVWAVEPHLAFRGIGAKWEELLVITEAGEAFWLDDDLPHVRRWQRRHAQEVAA